MMKHIRAAHRQQRPGQALGHQRPLARKLWRIVFFLFVVPFSHPGVVTAFIPVIPRESIVFLSGALLLFPLGTIIEYVTEDFAELFARRFRNQAMGELIGGLIHNFCTSSAYLALTVTTLLNAARFNPHSQDQLVTIVQISIAGTIITNMLFNTGAAIVVGSIKLGRLTFSKEYANQYAELLFIAVTVLALPSIAYRLNLSAGLFTREQFQISPREAATLSDITALILIITYACFFGWTVLHMGDRQGKTHEDADKEAMVARLREIVRTPPEAHSLAVVEQEGIARVAGEELQRTTGDEVGALALERKLEAERSLPSQRTPTRKPWWRRALEIVLLLPSIGVVVYISETMAHSIEGGLIDGLGLNLFVVGFIIVPVTTSLVEFSAAISHARFGNMDSSLAVTTGAAIQAAMFVAPLLVLVGHFFHLAGMNLVFGLFVLALFGLIAYLFQIITVDGETTWFEGAQLLAVFAAVAAIAAFAGPTT